MGERRDVAAIVSFASGKGGVGKSTTVSNLGLLLARAGSNVVLVDLDVGGADLHVMFGELSPPVTLSDFLARKVETLEAVARPVGWCPRLRLIAGTGDTLRNTNPAAQTKRRLERQVRKLSADFVLLDILGQIPADPAVSASIRRFLPVVEAAPNSPAAQAFQQVALALRGLLPPLLRVGVP
jgi:MinD-like ATPase involved in chromosome partitioning or flagellar assembly